MKNYFDSFYEIMHKNSVKRRRMISLLLVLSIFVSSGVLWELRDTVITMVNEPVCGLEEHEHTDECYEKVLVCGLEENEEHTHTEECYENVLVCGHDEHWHTPLCYTDEELHENDEQSEAEESKIVSIDYPDEEMGELDLPVYRLGDDSVRMLEGEQADQLDPQPIQTIDNIARGIKFTLFDYYENENALEAEQNNYDISWNSENNEWVHNNIKQAGLNYGRDPRNDILFFAYGTPAFTGYIDTFNKEGTEEYQNYKRDWDDENNKYNPSKNNYSGDYNKDSNGQTLSGNRPVQGIVENQLVNGYPKVVGSDEGANLAYLFDENDTSISSYKTSYTDVNHFLKSVNQNGVEHLVYNSDENYAYFDQSTNNFIVYNGTYHIINKDHHRAGDYNNLTDEEYGDKNGGEFKIGFFPFDQYDTNRRDPNYNGNGFNHHFGMKMEADFFNIKNSEEPIIFKYSGDDDMWVFVDDVLVLDIGGIHEPAAGMIDFTNGLIWTQDNLYGKSANVAYNELKNSNSNLPELSAISLPDNGVNTDGASESKWKVETIASKFTNVSKTWNDASGAKHSIKMFYLERGGCYSNLAMDMNLPTVKPITVSKTVDYGTHLDNSYDNKTYEFELLYRSSNSNAEYVRYERTGLTNPFTITDGERMVINGLPEGNEYMVVEKEIDTNIYSKVIINGQEAAINEGQAHINGYTLADVNVYNFENKIINEEAPITVRKDWVGGIPSAETIPDVKFKIYRTDEKGVENIVAINKKRTFKLSGSDWTYTSPPLPTRYGAHTYTYSVREQDVPPGYAESYRSNNGDLIITNTPTSDVQINVEKRWENEASIDVKPTVNVTLKRQYAEYEASKAASVTIKVFDKGGVNKLGEWTTNNAYVDGSLEFSINPPNGVRYFAYNDYPKIESGNEKTAISYLDGVFEVTNIAENTEIHLKYDNNRIDDSVTLFHDTFTWDTDGWQARGATIGTSGNNPYAKGDQMVVYNRVNSNGNVESWRGAQKRLDSDLFKPNHTYSFTAYARSFEKPTKIVLTLYDGTAYHRIDEKENDANSFSKLSGTITLPGSVNPYGMYLIVETDDINSSQFYVDEVVAVEGQMNIDVEAGTAKVTISNYNETICHDNSDTGYKGWNSFCGSTVERIEENFQSQVFHYIRITDREAKNSSVAKDLHDLKPGYQYDFSASVQNNIETDSSKFKLTLCYTNKANETKYIPVMEFDTTSGWNYSTKSVTNFPIPIDAQQNSIFVYIESADENKNSFRLREFEVKESKAISVTPEGYIQNNNGSFTQNDAVYTLTFDSDSVTKPLHLTADYQEDNNFNPSVVTLNAGNNWKKQWTKSELNESSNRVYKYYVVESPLGDDYVVTYLNDYVPTNTADDPIIIKNKYILYRLPATGGSGTGRIYFLGFVLTATGIISGSALYRRKRRRE
ncbi:fibro-slime domain-containing protein [Ruminococcus flavefaciens]|uniref:Fibro-slime domain-containing protein n=1 Tax=Ruminococcus flavefaciens TaxID=1265 RepID=A0A1M7M6G4_RUMFL|nr:fibro-slime domain-containing protein [Ruminococcus flavefaciens]SHM86302.1 fibro-slime domain-containing protein [Ruminococcus flavefaciens]